MTLRCWREDLQLEPRALRGPDEEDQFLRKFCTYSTVQPEGDRVREIRRCFVSKVPVGNHHRIATWYDRETDVVWLLGTGLKLGGERRDVYNHFIALDESDRLLPTVDDYDLYFQERDARAVPRMVLELQALLRRARLDAPEERSALIAGLVQITITVEQLADSKEAGYEEIWVAIATRNLQHGWLDVIRAALLPHEDPRAWEFVLTFPGRGDANPAHELRFRHFHAAPGAADDTTPTSSARD